jgi:DNA invertase Pin-like site-specific DNA recombinase
MLKAAETEGDCCTMATAPTKPKAYSYTRFSTPEQAQGDSARRQIDLAKRYAAKHGLALDDSLRLSDAGVSGFRGANVRRGALGQFLRAVDDGDVTEGSLLLVESLDRVSRQNPWDALPILQQIINAGVTIVTLFDEKVYEVSDMRKNPLKILESLFVMIRANEESETKSRRGKAVWVAKRSKANARPGDSVLTRRLPYWLTMEDGKIAPRPERVAVVRRIVTAFLVNGMGQHRIAEVLNREGVPVFGSGAMWHRSYVSKVLTSPALIGTLVPREVVYEGGRRLRKPFQPIEGYYPAVVSQEEWDDLTAMLKASGNRQPQQRKGVQNVLAGLAECSLCGSSMTRVMKGSGSKAGQPKLVCTRAKTGAGCQYHAIDLGGLEQVLRDGLDEVLDSAPSGDAAIDSEVQRLVADLEAIDGGLSVLIEELVERGRSPALSLALREQEAQKARLEARLSDALSRQSAASPASQERRRAELLNALPDGPVGTLNARLRGVFRKVLPDHRDGRVRFRWLGDGSDSAVSLAFAWPTQD